MLGREIIFEVLQPVWIGLLERHRQTDRETDRRTDLLRHNRAVNINQSVNMWSGMSPHFKMLEPPLVVSTITRLYEICVHCTHLLTSQSACNAWFRLVPKSVTLDDLEWPKRTLAEKIVLRSPPEKFERRLSTHTISGKMSADDSRF